MKMAAGQLARNYEPTNRAAFPANLFYKLLFPQNISAKIKIW
jgi:hypothetical protein